MAKIMILLGSQHKKESLIFMLILKSLISWDFLKNTEENVKKKETTLKPENLKLSSMSF